MTQAACWVMVGEDDTGFRQDGRARFLKVIEEHGGQGQGYGNGARVEIQTSANHALQQAETYGKHSHGVETWFLGDFGVERQAAVSAIPMGPFATETTATKFRSLITKPKNNMIM